jgi:hypothetical protein
MVRLLLVFLGFVLVSACSKTPELEVNAELQPYFDSFVQEAQKRGRTLTLDQINGIIGAVDEKNVAAKCQTLSSGHKNVLVDQTFWFGASSSLRELVVFHELGHCALGRTHTDAAKADGSCASMMQSGSGTCKIDYNTRNRSAYLDELFK